MPVHPNLPQEGMLFQRDQYAKPGLGRWYWDKRDEAVLKWVAGSRIIEVGCGEGILLEKTLRSNPGSLRIGIDIEQMNVDICRRHGLPVLHGSAESLPIRESSFDTALLIEVIEHLRRPALVLREIFRILKPGGRLALLFPNDTAFFAARLLTGRWKEAFYDPGHCRQWRPGVCRWSLVKTGFTVIHEESLPLNIWPFSLHHLLVASKPPV